MSLRTLLLLSAVMVAFSKLTDKHHSYIEMVAFLRGISQSYPKITHLYSIGQSVQGRQLYVLALASRQPDTHLTYRAEVKFVANIHGNEVVGRELMLSLIEYLTSNFDTNQTIQHLLTNSRLHILPSLNPDGYERAVVGDCEGVTGRYNARNVDLNRNFPEFFSPQPEGVVRQPETLAVMRWMHANSFVLSASFHGGALVASYPFDNYHGSGDIDFKPAHYSASPDDTLFRHLSLSYSKRHSKMYYGNACNDHHFANGITNGADWYPLAGGMQDYNYLHHGCLELTLEVSCCKYPSDPPSTFWRANKDSIMAYLENVKYGVHGFVNAEDGTPVAGASVDIEGVTGHVTSMSSGAYWRLLPPGQHVLRASVRGEMLSARIGLTITPSMEQMIFANITLYKDESTTTNGQITVLTFTPWFYVITQVIVLLCCRLG